MEEMHYKRSNRGGCCSRRTRLEKILIGASAVMTVICIILLILVAKKQADFKATNCSTQTCINEASTIIKYVDPSVNPCDNFLSFACDNFLKEVHGDEKFEMTAMLHAESERILLEAYMEPLSDKDHKIVKVSKKLFRACINESEIEMDGLATIKSALKSVGGWPVVEGPSWKEERFDWLKVTYKLRKLGYEFKVFLDLSVVPDITNSNRSVLKVATPYMWGYDTLNFDKVELMTDIAVKFGATNRELAQREMRETSEFLKQLQLEVHNSYKIQHPTKYAIGVYQERCRAMNWLEFINNVVGTTTQLSRTDLVIFPSPESMTNWLKIISLVPKRTQANYMMWKVIEASLPFLTDDLRNRNVGLQRNFRARGAFCLDEIQKRFTPSPIEVLNHRKYLPQSKRKGVEEVVSNIKKEFIANFENVNWMDEKDKKKILARIESVELVIGLPVDYFSDQVLDDLSIDLMTPKNDSLLNLIAQANRNRQTVLYNYATNNSTKNFYDKWYMKNSGGLPIYSEEDGVIFVPTISVKDALFHENGSNYLNYGALGTQTAFEFAHILTLPIRGYDTSTTKWANATKAGSREKVECVQNAVQNEKIQNEAYSAGFILQYSVGEKIAYESYRKWVKNHGEEKKLIGVDYTPNQLFWISFVLPACRPVNPIRSPHQHGEFIADLITASLGNQPDFAKDFKCSSNAKMNPSSKCELI